MDKIIIPTLYKLPTEPRGHTIKAIYVLAQTVQENNKTMKKISESLKDIAILKAEDFDNKMLNLEDVSRSARRVIEKLVR